MKQSAASIDNQMMVETSLVQGQRLSYGNHDTILFPGEADGLYRVVDGLVRLYTMDNEGNGLTLRYVKPDGFFGEEIFSSNPRRYFAEAVTHSVIEQISAKDISESSDPQLASYYGEVVTDLYRSMYRLANKQLRSRIAAELLDLQDSALSEKGSSGESVVKITHDDLASIVGSVRETVTKALGELSKLKAIEARYGKIALIDPTLLKTIAGE